MKEKNKIKLLNAGLYGTITLYFLYVLFSAILPMFVVFLIVKWLFY